MKKLISLIKACMTSDMRIFKIKTKNKSSNTIIPIILAFYIMFMIGNGAYRFMSKLAPMNLTYLVLALFAFGISLMTIMEGVYKVGPLLYNCRDDQLLLSLPMKRKMVLFVRIFKFYVFELIFNSMFILPAMIAYIWWGSNITWTYYLTSVVMLLFLPIIPIIISCIIGSTTSSISSRFKYKNVAQIISSMIILLGILYVSYNMDGIMNYFLRHADSINDLISKIYYPAGAYIRLINDFNILYLLLFILINIGLLGITIFILNMFYFKVNTRLKGVKTNSKMVSKELKIKSKSITQSLIKKELSTFFKTPVFIINAGFALVLYLIAVIYIAVKFDTVLKMITSSELGLNISSDLIIHNLSIVILLLIVFTSCLTSITNSLISLEGRNINILKSLPIKIKTILMSKIYACLLITTPVLVVGDIVLFIIFKTKIIELILLLVLSILIPLVSHFIGLIVNLKYPKLDAENSTEVVKQSTSSLVSVTIGMFLLIILVTLIFNTIDKLSPILLLVLFALAFVVIDVVLYLYLTKKGAKDFNKLAI